MVAVKDLALMAPCVPLTESGLILFSKLVFLLKGYKMSNIGYKVAQPSHPAPLTLNTCKNQMIKCFFLKNLYDTSHFPIIPYKKGKIR